MATGDTDYNSGSKTFGTICHKASVSIRAVVAKDDPTLKEEENFSCPLPRHFELTSIQARQERTAEKNRNED